MASVDARELAAIFVGGAAGTTVRASLATWLPATGTQWPWTTFAVNIVGALPARVLRHSASGATAAFELSAPTVGHRPLRGSDDLLDDAGRDRPDARQRSLRTCRRLHRRKRLPRVACRSRGDGSRAQGAGARMSVLVWAGVVVIGGLGSVLRFLVDRQVTRRTTSALPLGTLDRQPHRLLRASDSSAGSPPHQTSPCWQVPQRSAPTRRSPRGCSRPNGSVRSGRCRSRPPTSSSVSSWGWPPLRWAARSEDSCE